MRVSRLLGETLKETPKGAETRSHQYLIRGGFIHPLAAGFYTYMPLMQRVIHKISNIVREEMNRAGALEVTMPIVQPRTLWDASGRWQRYIDDGIMFHFKDRKEFELCLGPTHEEVITDLLRAKLRSYKNLPLNIYQIMPKYRDEIRPRFGIIRAREFIMKDGYSFDIDEAAMDVSYQKMYDAYCRIFDRCGFDYRVVEADSGAIGGTGSAEFMVIADMGEDTIMECPGCGYAANLEKAESVIEDNPEPDELLPLKEYDTPNIRTVEQLEEFFNLEARYMVKTILYQADDEVVTVLMRGDQDINEVKLANYLDAGKLSLADDETVQKITGAEVGFAGPVNLKNVEIIADESVRSMKNFLCGVNKSHVHCLNANLGRDFDVPEFADLRSAKAGDSCPKCSTGHLTETKGIEVGHIFKLGLKYSKALNLGYLDDNNEWRHIYMGCYGIGVSRIAAAAVEQSNDEDGIIWPESLSPYRVIIIPVSHKNETQVNIAEKLYNTLLEKGVEVIIDDREERLGFKAADADLIGYPWKVIIGRKADEGLMDIKSRADGEMATMTFDDIVAKFTE